MLILEGRFEAHVIRFSPDSRFLAVGRQSTALEMWPLFLPGEVILNEVPGFVRGLDFHPQKPLLYGRLGQGRMWVLSHANGTTSATHQFHPSADKFILSPDGSRIIVSGRADTRSRFGAVCFETGGKKQVARVWTKYTRGIYCRGLAWLAARNAFASLEEVLAWPENETNLLLRDGTGGQKIAKHPRKLSTSLCLAASNEVLVVASAMSLLVWPNATITSDPLRIPSDTRKHFTSIAFHPSGRYLAATSNDTTVKLYDTATWEVAKTFAWNVGRLRSVAFSPDGMLAAVGSDTGKIVVWDLDL